MCDETISEYIRRTYDPSPLKRKRALKELCPCHVRQDIPEVWQRVFEMLTDDSGIVRDQVLPNSSLRNSVNSSFVRSGSACSRRWVTDSHGRGDNGGSGETVQ